MVRREREKERKRGRVREREKKTMECVIVQLCVGERLSVPESHHAHQNRTSKGTAARNDSPDSIQSLAFQMHFLRDQVRDGHVKIEMCWYSECF